MNVIEDACYDEVGLSTLKLESILVFDSLKMIGRAFMVQKKMLIFTLTLSNFCISILVLKLEITIFVICNW